MINKKLIDTTLLVLCLLTIVGCNKFDLSGWASSFGYNVDECEVRDRFTHAARYADGTNPGRATIGHREFRCRIERVCIGKSEAENEKCKEQARSYWGYDERNKTYELDKYFDDSWDAVCTNNPDTKRCHPKWKPQANYSTNPYWNKETQSYIMPQKLKK